MQIKERFLDKDVLIEALLSQKLVQYDRDMASLIAELGELVQFGSGDTIIEQNGSERDVYFLIMGKVSLTVKGSQFPYTRDANISVGEMSALNPTLPRSATVKAIDDTVAIKLDVKAFQQLAEKYPKIHAILAKDLAERLNQRNELIANQNEKARLFIISTVESNHIAKKIKAAFFHNNNVEVKIWSETDVFKGGDYTLEALEKAVKDADFGLAILQDDDIIISRDDEKRGPRDNVVFELGLFMGLLTHKRTFIAIEKDVEQKLASDLQGLTPLQYKRETGNQIDVSKLVYDLEILINDQGIRNKLEC